MGRRTVLLIVAALIAALGTGMVFLYVRGADNRAVAGQAPVQVLKAVAQIEPGETMAAAQAAGKIQLGKVPRSQVLVGAVNSVTGLENSVALSTIYPNEQIVTAKFGAAGDQDTLTIPDGNIAISVNLTDTGRVAGFVNPGASVAVFVNTASDDSSGAGATTRLLLPKVQVIAVGDTTVVNTTTTDPAGAQTTEQLPKTLFTLSVPQTDAERIMYAVSHGELSFGLLNDKSKVKTGPGVTAKNLFG
ncbi:Flp pilus assembly protein CpaB [Nocardioides panacis]|uniref:Flp pilus assembly protein CpaB n=1 Tax=Nocardioides panacis TaxID=2849501 RepID=A0A975SUY0_9ACTN|nr:Flp pilus assembly protein CpaB [Nocardioides panacis]QWZ06362.1 Flp pilus assembly protein CpaB [Nocardioides panacis]